MRTNWKAAWVAVGAIAGCAALPATAAELPLSPGLLDAVLILSEGTVSALAAVNGTATPVVPGTLSGLNPTLPVVLLEGSSAALSGASFNGGFSWQSVPNFANVGGSLTISELRLDVAYATVYGRVDGANGLISHPSMALFTFSTVEKNELPPYIFAPESPSAPGTEVFRAQLSWTSEARGAIAQGLGLNDIGQSIWGAVPIAATLSLATPVPEPSTWALSALGLVGVAALHRRRQKGENAAA